MPVGSALAPSLGTRLGGRSRLCLQLFHLIAQLAHELGERRMTLHLFGGEVRQRNLEVAHDRTRRRREDEQLGHQGKPLLRWSV